MSEQLPTGWIRATLGQITRPSQRRTLPVHARESKYVGLEHIEPHTMTLVGHGVARDVRSSSLSFSRGDLLYGRLRPYLNKIWVAEFDGLCSGEFLVFPSRAGLNNHFLSARLNARDFVAFANECANGERPRVSFKSLSRFLLLLPPSAEQDRIVARLNAAMIRIRAGEVAARRARQRVQRYRETVLQAAVTGDLSATLRRATLRTPDEESGPDTGVPLLPQLLTSRRPRWEAFELQRLRDMGREPKTQRWKRRYKAPTLPKSQTQRNYPAGWVSASIDQLAWASGYGTSAKCTYEASGPPVLRIPNIRNRRLDVTDIKFAPGVDIVSAQALVAPGDMLVIRTNGSKDLIGRAAVVTTRQERRYAFASYLVRFRLLGEEPLWSWISLVWDSPMFRSTIQAKAKTTAGQYNLSLSSLSDIEIPLPSLPEQREIVRAVSRRMDAADRLVARVDTQLQRAHTTRETLMREAFRGTLVPQDPQDLPASRLLEQLACDVRHPSRSRAVKAAEGVTMRERAPIPEVLRTAWRDIDEDTDAGRLFNAAKLSPEQVLHFYEVLRDTPEIRDGFQRAGNENTPIRQAADPPEVLTREPGGRFRLVELWLEDFKNLKDYAIRFPSHAGLDVVLGWNGTGKSNLFEALVILFRDLYEWHDGNRWPAKPMNGFRLVYELNEHTIEVVWSPQRMKRPVVKKAPRGAGAALVKLERVEREQLVLPGFVFGYYSGPTNRLAEHFLPMKQAHYDRLRGAPSDDAGTLASLLEKRRFFCAETHHAKYVLLAFLYREDPTISDFLERRLRIVGFESALFVIRKPRWAKKSSKAQDFWGATGIMRRVMERLRDHAIAPMVLKQKVSYGYRSTTEEHYYFLLPDLASLYSFAGAYQDARTFFLALESTDFSELIHDVKIQVRVKSNETDSVSITFRQMSEGEQQLLMVLGLMRFTQSHQSLVLLDEPDTHLNPHWSVSYVKDLARVMSEGAEKSAEQRSSQILLATHDPLVIAGLVKEQIHLLLRDLDTGECKSAVASADPRGLGFAGILTSEMFGFRSDLDEDTVADLDRRVRLVGKEATLTAEERVELEAIDRRLADAGFATAFSDPYYAAFVRAWGRRHGDAVAGQESVDAGRREEIDRIAQEVLREALAEMEAKGEQ